MVQRKQKVKDYVQFQLRLPPDLRERIKEKSDRAGMSMNEAIVWVLEKEFPAKVTLEEKLETLATLVSMLKDSKDTPAGVDNLIEEIQGTLETLGYDTDRGFYNQVQQRLDYWRELELDNWRDRNESLLQDDHWPPHFSDASDDQEANDPFPKHVKDD